MTIRTARLLLREWRTEDREPFAAMNADPRVMEFFPSLLTPEQSDHLMRRIEDHFHRHGFAPWAVERHTDGRFLGYVGLAVPEFTAHFTPAVEIGWRLSAESWGQGYASEGAAAVADYAFRTVGLEELVSFTVPDNVRSRRVMEKLGMTHNPADDFDHPKLPEGHAMRRHVLYRLARADWKPSSLLR